MTYIAIRSEVFVIGMLHLFKKIHSPMSMQWEVTPVCNYNCIHCYNYWRKNESERKQFLDRELVIAQIVECMPAQITFTGGEPLLMFDEIKPYIEKLQKHAISVSINTNAAYIDDNIAQYLGENVVRLLVSLPCSIPEINDKITNCKSSFEATTNGVKTALKNGVQVGMHMVVSKINREYVIETAKFVKEELGLKRFMATKASRPENATREYDQFEMDLYDLRRLFDDLTYIKNELGMEIDSLTAYPECSYETSDMYYALGARRRCSAGKTVASIGYDGDVKACARASQSYGNLSKDTIVDCWDRMDEWRKDLFLPENCRECDRRIMCGGACRVEACTVYGSMNADDPCADYNNLPVKFKYPSVKVYEYEDNERFLVSENFNVINEIFGKRIVIGGKNAFITDELYSFVDKYSGKVFLKSDLRSYFQIDDSLANSLCTFLKNHGICVPYF